MRKLGGIVTLVVALTVGILGGQTSSEAQQAAKTPRIGVLFSGAPATSSHAVAAFDQGMRDRGYGEREIVIERRFGEARIERMAEIAAELVGLKVDVIVASTDAGISSVRGRAWLGPAGTS
jgi:ABC-type uncharacterized transport system substrate-binding protein